MYDLLYVRGGIANNSINGQGQLGKNEIICLPYAIHQNKSKRIKNQNVKNKTS